MVESMIAALVLATVMYTGDWRACKTVYDQLPATAFMYATVINLGICPDAGYVLREIN